MSQLFNPGRIVSTPGALRLADGGVNLAEYFFRHLRGDWGSICEEDQLENDLSLEDGFRLVSVYQTPLGTLWIITEADRSATTFLLPSEY